MRRSWLGFQLVLLSSALLLAVVAEDGRHDEEEEGSIEEEDHGEEDAGKKKHSHAEEEGKSDNSKVLKKGHPLLKLLEDAAADSSEISKRLAKEEEERISGLAAQTTFALSPSWKEQAITHFNQGSEGTYYKHLEDGQLEYRKAIGVMIYVKMHLARTNCTKTEEEELSGVEISREDLEKKGCKVLPEFKKEKHNCTFGIFLDMRTEKKTVIHQECIINSYPEL